jgi:hypothetical protein
MAAFMAASEAALLARVEPQMPHIAWARYSQKGLIVRVQMRSSQILHPNYPPYSRQFHH